MPSGLLTQPATVSSIKTVVCASSAKLITTTPVNLQVSDRQTLRHLSTDHDSLPRLTYSIIPFSYLAPSTQFLFLTGHTHVMVVIIGFVRSEEHTSELQSRPHLV